MVFSSLTFLYVFLPLVFAAYFLVPQRWKNLTLLVFSLVFYAWGEPLYILLMLGSTAVDFGAGLLLDRFDQNARARKAIIIASIAISLLTLGVFKYASFFVGSINSAFGLTLLDPNLPLPIGISFYTFQSMSYTIDLYWRKIPVQRSFLNYAMYVSLFPQLVAGPIVRYEHVVKEIDNREITMPQMAEGVKLFIIGLGKKVLLANNMGSLWTTVKASDYGELSAATAWLGILAFTFQIYFDFSGYSDMAIGLGRMLGFHFPPNFNYPYISRSISEFWRRWHMTLGSWFRTYVYIPLGGNRDGLAKTIRNLIIVWFLTGLWHGASWNFVLWGLYFGFLIMLERLFLGKLLERIPAPLSMMYSFLAVVLGWVLFDVDTLSGAMAYLGAMFGGSGVGADSASGYLFSAYGITFLLCIIGATALPAKLWERIRARIPVPAMAAIPVLEVLVLLAATAYLVNATYNPFLYFRF